LQQSNYFGKGDTSSFDRMVYVPVADTQATSHTYGVNWTSAAITWLVDGVPIRTLLYEDAKDGSRFPQTPMKLKVGVWAGGDADKNAEGTVTWAMGGKEGSTNYADGPFSMYVESINIVNYSPADSYTYGDNTGSYQSIKVEGGEIGGVLSPEEAAADLAPKPSGNASITTGSGVPIKPLATATANGTQTGSFVTSTIDGLTVVSAATATSSTTSQEANSASNFGIAGGVLGTFVLSLCMTVFA
jgi:beta-glucanase (GH16 family)